MFPKLRTYEDFISFVGEIGFMTLSENPAGWPSLAGLTESGQWFTDAPDDPWRWRLRIVEERGAAYAKLFHGMPSFVSREWYPAVFAARRGPLSFDDVWELGRMRDEARRVYELFRCRSLLATHEIRQLGGFTGKTRGRMESALTSLQTGMFITVSGMTRMTTLDGRPHSWPATEYRRAEDWAWDGALQLAAGMDARDAADRIAGRMLEMKPGLTKAELMKFIGA